MADPRSAGIFSALRAAAHQAEERHLVGLTSDSERARISAALSAEGQVVEEISTGAALERLAEESFELTVLDIEERGGLNPLSAGKELRPFTDLIFLMGRDPVRCGEAFAAEAAAVIPRPLPDNDALLRAHLRWLASCRRSRSRGLLLKNALARHGAELTEIEPALAKALSEIVGGGDQEPTVMVMGDADLVRVAGGRPVETLSGRGGGGAGRRRSPRDPSARGTRARRWRRGGGGRRRAVRRAHGQRALRGRPRLSPARADRAPRSGGGLHRDPAQRRGQRTPVGRDAGPLRRARRRE